MPANSPVFSIITVVFNGEQLLEGTILSVLNQTYPHVEYVIVDGASKDGTLSIVERYAARLARWKSEPDEGIYDGMNKGLAMATGDFVLFLNCGDHLYAPDTLEKVAQCIDSQTDCVYGEMMVVDSARREMGLMSAITPHRYPSVLTWQSMRFGMNVCHQSFFARRSIAPNYILGNLAADIDWVIRCLKKSRKTVNAGVVVSAYLMDGVSKQKHRQSLIDRYAILRGHFGFWPNLFNHAYIVWRAFWFKWRNRGKTTY